MQVSTVADSAIERPITDEHTVTGHQEVTVNSGLIVGRSTGVSTPLNDGGFGGSRGHHRESGDEKTKSYDGGDSSHERASSTTLSAFHVDAAVPQLNLPRVNFPDFADRRIINE